MMIELPPEPRLWLPPRPAIIRPATPELLQPPRKEWQATFPGPIFTPRVPPAAVTIGTVAQQSSTTDSTTYSFGSLTAGVANTTFPIIGISGRSAAVPAVSSVLLGGQTCTEIYTVLNGTNIVAFYAGPRGVTGNVDITWTVTMVRMVAALWPVENLFSQLTATDKNTSTADPMVATINCLAGGCIIGFAYNGGGASDNMVWTNLTERFDVNVESTAVFSGASDVFATAQTARSITANPANAGVSPLLGQIALR